MKTPYLQIALDNVSLEDAFRTLSGGLGQAGRYHRSGHNADPHGGHARRADPPGLFPG